MRLVNLPDGVHVKVIWSRARSRDCTRDKASRQRDSKMWWRRTTATLLGVSFGGYRRLRRDVLMGRGGYVPLRRLGDLLTERRHYVPMRRHHNIPIRRREDASLRRREDVSLRRLGDVPLRRRWVFHLRRTCTSLGRTERRRYDVARTSCCRVSLCLYKNYTLLILHS